MEHSEAFINTNKKYRKKYALEKYFSEEIHEFHSNIDGYRPTPLINFQKSSLDFLPDRILIKDESKRIGTGAFKALGASWAIHEFLKKNNGNFTFCTATDGNHGRSVAWSARIMRQKAVVFMPSVSTKSRIKFIENEGAKVHIVDGDYDETVRTAISVAREKKYILIQDTSWPGYTRIPNYISAGYITMLNELRNQLNEQKLSLPDVFIFQSGVGSWAASMILFITLNFPNASPLFFIAEPLHSDCLLESIKNNTISKTRKDQKTIMAGLNCGSPSMSAWEIISDLADAFISIPDEFSIQAMKALNSQKIPVETCESGAAGLGAIMSLYSDPAVHDMKIHFGLGDETSFMIFNTEGNTDPDSFKSYLNS